MTASKKDTLVELKVIEKKFMQSVNEKTGKVLLEPTAWLNNFVRVDNKVYKAGQKFKVSRDTADELLMTGNVQLASEPDKVFRPPFLDHHQQESDEIRTKENADKNWLHSRNFGG